MGFFSHDGGETYNRCHCKSYGLLVAIHRLEYVCAVWSNFEIADMDFWRGPAYIAFFEYLDSTGGFYYEVRVRCLVPLTLLGLTFPLCSCDSVGEMHRSIALLQGYSHGKINFIFLKR